LKIRKKRMVINKINIYFYIQLISIISQIENELIVELSLFRDMNIKAIQ
jgi:hypothetical protein